MGDTERTRITPVRKDYETLDEAALVLDKRYAPDGASDRFALAMVKLLRAIADTFFARRYGNRAIVLETVAAVPGMVGGTLQHLKCLRRLCDDEGWIFTLLDEAENERMHLMTFMEIIHPAWYERLIVVLVQAIFYNAFFLLYLISDKTAHRLVGYFEEEGWSAIPSTCSASTAATRRTCRRRSSRSITGACPRMRGCARWWK